MKFLVDAQLPGGLCDWLVARGHEAVHVGAIGLGAASDHAVARHAAEHDLILISKDDDFLVIRLPDRFALLWLRCGNATNRTLRLWLEPRWQRVDQLLAAGERLIELR